MSESLFNKAAGCGHRFYRTAFLQGTCGHVFLVLGLLTRVLSLSLKTKQKYYSPYKVCNCQHEKWDLLITKEVTS